MTMLCHVSVCCCDWCGCGWGLLLVCDPCTQTFMMVETSSQTSTCKPNNEQQRDSRRETKHTNRHRGEHGMPCSRFMVVPLECVRVFVCACACTCTCTCVCVCARVCTCMHMPMCMCMCMCTWAEGCVACVRPYMYTSC